MTIEQKRAAFEAWYVEHFKEHTGREDFTLEVMQSMRGLHNDYRENAYLHGLWIGYQAALESSQVQDLKDALQAILYDMEAEGNGTGYEYQNALAVLAAMEAYDE